MATCQYALAWEHFPDEQCLLYKYGSKLALPRNLVQSQQTMDAPTYPQIPVFY